MKLRIKDDSVRLRITKPELQELWTQGQVCASTEFLNHSYLNYQLKVSPSVDELKSEFNGHTISVLIPRVYVNKMIDTDLVGFDEVTQNKRIIVEKDFACLKPRVGEDETDAFEHPEPGNC